MPAKIELDFKKIKENLKSFLQDQEVFSDYNFEGSGFNVLLDALSYSTHYQAITANMAMSEAFLDSAQIRKNVVARVRDVNYFPRQISSAIATVRLDVSASSGDTNFTVARGTRFISSIDGFSYTFVTTDDINMIEDGTTGNYSVDIVVSQGVFRTQTFIHTGDPTQRYILSQKDVDATENYFTVKVRFSNSTELFLRSTSLSNIVSDTPVYYIQEAENSNVEIYFGDGILGKPVVVNDEIDVSYLATKGKLANGANLFSLIDNINSINATEFTVTTVSVASGGSDQESIESIKFNGPLVNTTQERAITINDYRTLVLNKYPAIQSLNVWGGEENIPPQYGRVFIAIKPTYGLTISPATKTDISNTVLNKFSAIGITPEIIDAEYTYINVTSLVTYDDDRTILKIGELTTKINNDIVTYFDDIVSNFNTDFRFSKLTTFIDNISSSINGNVTSISLTKKFTPISGQSTSLSLSYNSELNKGSITSNIWTDTNGNLWEIKDDSLGNLFLYRDGIIYGNNIGQIDYTNGVIKITNGVFLTPSNDQEISVEATPTITNIKLITNNILLLGTKNIIVEKFDT